MQSGNLYVYGANNPVMYADMSGNFVITTAALLVGGGALLFGTVGGLIGNHIANENGVTGWDKAGYIAGGAAIGAVGGGLLGYAAAPTIASATGIAGISVSAGVPTVIATTTSLSVPSYVTNAGSFINWAKQAFESSHQELNLSQVQKLFQMAKDFGVKISADLSGHPNSAWEGAHIHLGDKRIHVAITEDAIKWVADQLAK